MPSHRAICCERSTYVTAGGEPVLHADWNHHFGNQRHFSVARLDRLLQTGSFERVTVNRARFPFFSLCRMVVFLHDRRPITDAGRSGGSILESGASGAVLRFFDQAFRSNSDSFVLGWRLVAEAYRPGGVEP